MRFDEDEDYDDLTEEQKILKDQVNKIAADSSF